MFSSQETPRVFGTQSNQNFPDALLEGLTKRLKGFPPEDWAKVVIYVNTRRMQRRLSQLFLSGPARILPKINLITDIAHEPTLTDSPMPIPTLERRLEITQLVRGLLSRVEGLAPRSAFFDLWCSWSSFRLHIAATSENIVSSFGCFLLVAKPANSVKMRDFISFAALLVKVMASKRLTCSG